MIKAVVIDDEKHSIETLKWKLENYCPEVEIISSFSDPVKGLEYLRENAPDLLFLDIEMPMLNGFDILEELGEISFDVIFTTAYDDFGIQAIKFSALDYLLKPIQNQELKKAIEKFANKGAAKKITPTQLEVLFKNIKEEENGKPGKIALSTKESIEFVSPEDIIVCSSLHIETIIQAISIGAKYIWNKDLKGVALGFCKKFGSNVHKLIFVRDWQLIQSFY